MRTRLHKRRSLNAQRVVIAGFCVMFVILVAALGTTAQKPQATEAFLTAQRGEYRLAAGAEFQKEVALAIPVMMSTKLMLVSPQHPLPENAAAPNVRLARSIVGLYLPITDDLLLERDAIYALCDLQTDHPITQATFYHGAISPKEQTAEQTEAFARYSLVMPVADALREARLAVPDANCSEHQTGYALDIKLTGMLEMGRDDRLMQSSEGVWLSENLWQYGFVRRSVACEGIHIRYVGKVHAAAIYALGVELEGYLQVLHQHGSLTLYRGDEVAAYLLCVPTNQLGTIRVPTNADVEVTPDNLGYTVVTILPL